MSTTSAANSNPPPQPAEQPEKTKMPDNDKPSKGADAQAEESKPALDLALSQLESVRGDLRNAVTGLTKLGDLLRQAQREQKAAGKEISSVRATLRSLQSVRL
jgi:hypothetical protein